mmetsp:Transcript_7459/g.15500  ORF Transcript_7459/g.15500 Transcript_7459/m.15500 type:complete len:814 (-) Transcript_7459:52-2493(-)
MHLPLHVSLPALLLLCAFLLLPPSAADKSPERAPLDAEINNKRIVNGQEPIDFSSSNYPLHELGFPVGAGAPKLPIPELFPVSMHLPHPTPLTVLTVETPSISYPYVNQRIHYKICGYNQTLCTAEAPPEHLPARTWRSVLPGQSIGVGMDNLDDQQDGLTLKSVLIKQPLKVTVALFTSSGWDGDRDPLLNQTMHPSDSDVIIRDYYMSNERYGTAYITPNYDGKSYRGDLAEVDLETAKYNHVRLHGIETDFSDYYSVSSSSLDGIDPYVSESSSNREDQIMVKRLTNLDPDLAGFQGGFGALYGTTSYGFMVPNFNGVEHSGKVVRITSGHFNVSASDNWIADQEFRQFRTVTGTKTIMGEDVNVYDVSGDTDFSAVDVLDLTTIDPELKGFIGGFNHGDYAYFVPFFNGQAFSGKLVRVHIHTFDAASVQILDVSQVDKRLTGFYGGFSTNLVPSATNGLANNYAYLVPYKNVKGPIDGVNTKYTADGFKHNNVYDDKEAIGGDHLEPNHHGYLVRVNLDTFALADVSFIDLQTIDSDLKGFSGGFQGGRHGYLTPNSKGFNDYASKVVRFDLIEFTADRVEVLDLASKNDQLKGFVTGFAYDHHAYFVPYQNGRSDVNYRQRNQHSLLTRVDLNDFTPNGIKTLDVSTVTRKNTPSFPDNNLRGFVNGFCAGSFMYLVPHFNGLWYGKVVRIDARDFDALVDAQAAGNSTDLRTPYKGVQEVDLQRFSAGLAGFSGGFIRLRPIPDEKFFEVNRAVFNYATGLDRLQARSTRFSPFGQVGATGTVSTMPEGVEKPPNPAAASGADQGS